MTTASKRSGPALRRLAQLTTRDFGTVTRGFAAADVWVAVCVLPGPETAFSNAVGVALPRFIGWKVEKLGHTTAIFRPVNKGTDAAPRCARISGRAHSSPDNTE